MVKPLPKVIMCSALEQIGIEESWTLIKDYLDLAKSELYFTKKPCQSCWH